MNGNESQPDLSDYTPRQRVGQVLVLILLIMILSLGGVSMLWQARAEHELFFSVRALLLVTAVLMLLGAAGLFIAPIKRKLSTGRFFLTRAEVLARRAEVRARMGAGKPFWPQARPWIVGWAILALLAGLGITTLVLAVRSCDCGWKLSGLLLALAATLLFLPAFFTVKSVLRKRKTGSFLPSQEELDKARSKCAQPKPLRQRIVLAGFYWLIALLWTFSAFGHHGSYQGIFGSKWIAPALWWLVALIWTWQIFYAPASQCAIDRAIDSEAPLSIIKPPESDR
jgi:hypothetical protein